MTYQPESSRSRAVDIEADRGNTPRVPLGGTESSFSMLEGRSYRFQSVLSEPQNRPSVPQSYTATQDSIRGSTAALASMAVGAENESSVNDPSLNEPIANPSDISEGTPLLSRQTVHGTYSAAPDQSYFAEYGPNSFDRINTEWETIKGRVKSVTDAAQRNWNWLECIRRAKYMSREEIMGILLTPVHLLPSVLLGMLLNVLDGVSYGMIMFPTSNPIFASFGGDGVSMYFLSCIVAQLIYSLGGSIFHGGNGTMMIEVVPFYHILVQVITQSVGVEHPETIIATTIASFALSSVFTGITFFFLGTLRLGIIVSYFPRHILVGCIGGVGVFLIETGLAVCARLEGSFKYNLDTWRYFTQNYVLITQWAVPFALAVLLRVITYKVHNPIIFPAYFLVLPFAFYAIALASGHGVGYLRENGWVFKIDVSSASPWHFFTYFDLSKTSFSALLATIPTQCALVFFGILHVPLNVPALGVSVGEDNVDTNRELMAHGLSNVAAGLIGTVPNYLCYVNSVLFYKLGGTSRLSGVMLAMGTALIFFIGPSAIGFLPVMVVGALIFVLGIDLVKEAIWDTFGRVNSWEYLTILVIVVVMTISDFVVGVLVGIVLACLFFVMQTSQRCAVRAMFDGRVVHSTVRRNATHRRFLVEIGTQTLVIKLQGFLFFGTVNAVEGLIRKVIDIATWENHPIRFLILDFSLVTGVDFSAAETLTRVQRLINAKGVVLVFAGIAMDSDTSAALQRVDLWMDRGMNIEVFSSLNEALEWSENEYLRSMYMSDLSAGYAPRKATLSMNQGHGELTNVIQNVHRDSESQISSENHTHALIAAALAPYASDDCNDVCELLVPHLTEVILPQGAVLWETGDAPEALYFIESGILRANYLFEQEGFEFTEAMLAGTIAGELSFLSQQRRSTTVVAEHDARLWRLDEASLSELATEDAPCFRKLIQILLRVTSDEQDVLMSYLVSRLS